MENRTETWPTHSDVRAGSGREVEAAPNVIVSSCGCGTTHIHGHHHELNTAPSKVEEIKTRGLDLVDDLKSRSMEAVDALKSKSATTVEALKARSITTADTLKREATIRKQQLKSSMADAQVTARREMDTQVVKMQRSMRTEPMMWAGIAAGSGMALGLIGRYIHWRNTRRVPLVVVRA